MLAIILIASILNDHPDYYYAAKTCNKPGSGEELYLENYETVKIVNDLKSKGAMGN